MEIPPPIIARPLETAEYVEKDVSCRKCAYNLRGLSPLGRCPECGTPVGLSTQGDLLRFADPQWVETLARGARWIVGAFLIGIIGSIAGAVVTALGAPAVMQIVQLLANVASLYGVWLLTTPDPSRLGDDKYGAARKVVRITVLAGLSGALFPLILAAVGPSGIVLVLFTVLVLFAGLAQVAGEFAKLFYLEKMAERVPVPALERRARQLRWAYTIFLGASILAGGMMGIVAAVQLQSGKPTTSLSDNPLLIGLGCAAGIGVVAILIVMLLIIILVHRLGKEFREQAGIARMIWATAADGMPNGE